MRRPFCAMGLTFLCGILIARYRADSLIAVCFFAAVIGSIALCCAWKNQGFWQYLITVAVLLSACLGYVRCDDMMREKERLGIVLDAESASVTIQGRLVKKEYKNNQYICYLSNGAIKYDDSSLIYFNRYRIPVYLDEDTLSIGTTVVCTGTATAWNVAHNEGNYDEKSYSEAQGYAFALKAPAICAVYGTPSRWKERLWNLKMKWRAVYAAVTDEETGGILATMVLGDKTLLDSEVKRLYQICGISHVLAISGLHISVIGASLYHFLRRRGMRFCTASAAAAMILYQYGMMIGMGTSVRRAVTMFFLMLAADVFGRGYDSFQALGIAGLLLLWSNPMLLWDAGFQFSFVAVIGAVGASALLRGREESSGKPTKMQVWRDTLFVTVGIQLVTLPLAALYYFEIPTYAVVLNLLILPAMGLLLGIGILGGIAGIFYLSAGKLFLLPACLMLRIQLWICARVSALPCAMAIIGKPAAQIIFCYYLILFCMIGLLRHRNFAPRRIGLGACTAALLALLCVPKVRGIETDYLDVGQGDGIYLHTSSNLSLFVDGGSSDVSKVGTYRILPFLKAKGIRMIDYWFLSHTDSDHISGLLELLEADYPVGCLMVGENLKGQEEEVLDLAAKKEIPIVYLSAGDVLHLDGENVYLRIVSPEGTESSDDANEESLVFFYEDGGFSTIFTGDIGETTEKRLLADGVLAQVDVYKTAHHGSRYSNTSEFLEALSPKCAVISCAKKNTYGHPSEEAISHITESGAALFLTMERGQVKVRAGENGGIEVETMY